MSLFILLLIFQLKHFFADGVLQTEYHLGKFKASGWVVPLTSHCSVHAVFTAFVLYAYHRLDLGWLIVFDFVSHFVMDRMKASPALLGRWKYMSGREYVANESYIVAALSCDDDLQPYLKKKFDNRMAWLAILFDQMWHHTSDIILALLIERVL